MSDRRQERSAGAAAFLATRAGALLLACAALTACDTRGGKIPYNSTDFGPPLRSDYGTPAYDIPLGPMDVLKVSVFRVTDLSGEYQVGPDGLVQLPLIGAVSVRDQRPEEFARQLEKLYSAKYLNNPDITVRVVSTNRNNVTVEGGVYAAGIYSLPGQTTLLGAVALARGVNINEGNAKRVVIFRKRDGNTVAAAFDLTSIRHGETADPIIYPGDTVVVDSSKLRSVFRDLISAVPLIAIFGRL